MKKEFDNSPENQEKDGLQPEQNEAAPKNERQEALVEAAAPAQADVQEQVEEAAEAVEEVAEALAAQFAVEVDKRKISMADIKAFGSYEAEIKLHPGISAKVTVMVSE